MVCSLPPKAFSRGSMKIMQGVMVRAEMINVSVKAFPKIRSACGVSFRPRQMEIWVAAPAPMSIPKAWRKSRIGNVSVKPEIASGPTP